MSIMCTVVAVVAEESRTGVLGMGSARGLSSAPASWADVLSSARNIPSVSSSNNRSVGWSISYGFDNL